jgi:hypothetical protein
MTLSRMGTTKAGKAKKLTHGYKVTGPDHKPIASYRALGGPWGLVEHGSEAHTINAGGSSPVAVKGMSRVDRLRATRQRDLDRVFGARGTYSGVKPMRLPDGGFRYKVSHPGTKGKEPFNRGVASAIPSATKILERTSILAVERAFGRG